MPYIKEDEIIKNNIQISKSPIKLDNYDMYNITFHMKNGTTRIIKTFCEKGTFPDFQSQDLKKVQQQYGQNVIAEFFVKRLLGPNGLMQKERRDDYIYLGKLSTNGYKFSRYERQLNGKNGQENFEEGLFGLKLQVEAKENQIQNNQSLYKKPVKGKTYVIADIHGMYGSYIDIIKKMTTYDYLIILGDVIDRGTGGIQIIQDIMQRKQNKQNNPEITFMLGNHEMQFLETVATMIRRGLHKEDLIAIMNRRAARAQYGYYSLHSDPKSKKSQEEWKKKLDLYDVDYQRLINEKGLTEWELDIMGIWLNSNKGNTTIFDFLQGGRVNGAKEQQAIYSFLCDSYVALPKNINGKDYLFVHAMPPKEPQMISQMKQSKKGYKFKELTREQYKFMLEERDKSMYEQAKAYGFTTVCGHTPEFGEILIDDNKGFVRIDAGCGHKQKKSKLALYCVDDGKVEYFDEKETTQEQQVL